VTLLGPLEPPVPAATPSPTTTAIKLAAEAGLIAQAAETSTRDLVAGVIDAEAEAWTHARHSTAAGSAYKGQMQVAIAREVSLD
jgi:hypothetical protein